MDNDNLLEEYYTQNARKLRRMVDRILRRFSGISQKDYDDFYSLANEVFTGALRRFDGTQSFEGFLYACLFNRIKTEFTKRNREKRKTDTQSVSLIRLLAMGKACWAICWNRILIWRPNWKKRNRTYRIHG